MIRQIPDYKTHNTTRTLLLLARRDSFKTARAEIDRATNIFPSARLGAHLSRLSRTCVPRYAPSAYYMLLRGNLITPRQLIERV